MGLADGVYWFSTPRMTIACGVNQGVVLWAAPVAHRFIGQPIGNLLGWLQRQGGLRQEALLDGPLAYVSHLRH